MIRFNKRTILNKAGIPAVCLSAIILFGSFTPDKKNFDIAKNLEIFNALMKELNMFYVDTINSEKVITKGINSMLGSLDPYTNYIPESEKEDFRFMTTGEYGGIGSLIVYRDSDTYISEPYEGMPAQIAGLKPGDKIIKIDGTPTHGLKSDKVSEMLKGTANTVVIVTVERPDVKEPITKEITRKKIQMNAVPYYGIVGDKTGYIYLSNFTDKAAGEVKDALLDLKKNQQIESLVLDLRGNPGGILEEDLDRAVIVGERTYGKGLVQSTRTLPYNGTLKVTTAKYYIPSGRLIQAIDYSHRNPDGSVGRIPDSLTTAFKTANGRIVRDGGGIKPDIEVEKENPANICFYLVNDLIIFDYANRYAAKHPTIAPIGEFKLTDEDYNDFKEFVKSKDFKYDRQSDKVLNELRKVAQFEGYLDEASEEFKALENKLSHNLDKDLDTFRKDIEELLTIEIVKRYYHQKGEIRQSLRKDEDLDKALEILNDKAAYNKILNINQNLKSKK